MCAPAQSVAPESLWWCMRQLAIADRATVLQVGRVVEDGTAAALRDSPAVRAAFLGG